MAATNTTLAAGEIGSGIITTTGGTVDSVDLSAVNPGLVEVLNHDGADWLWFTVDGSTPTVGGKKCRGVPPSAGAALVVSSGATDVVKIISAAACAYVISVAEA